MIGLMQRKKLMTKTNLPRRLMTLTTQLMKTSWQHCLLLTTPKKKLMTNC